MIDRKKIANLGQKFYFFLLGGYESRKKTLNHHLNGSISFGSLFVASNRKKRFGAMMERKDH